MQPDLFDRPRALACLGSEAVLQQVVQQFLQESQPMLSRLDSAVASGDAQNIRQVVHWLKGGLTYLFSPAAEQAWQQLDQASRQQPLPDLAPHCARLRQVVSQLQGQFGSQPS